MMHSSVFGNTLYAPVGTLAEICEMGGYYDPYPIWRLDPSYRNIAAFKEEQLKEKAGSFVSQILECVLSAVEKSAAAGQSSINISFETDSEDNKIGFSSSQHSLDEQLVIKVHPSKIGRFPRKRLFVSEDKREPDCVCLALRNIVCDWAEQCGITVSDIGDQFITARLVWVADSEVWDYKQACQNPGGYEALLSGVPLEDVLA